MIIRFLSIIVGVTLCAAAPAGATPSLQDQIFDPGCVSHVYLTAPQTSIDALTSDPTGVYQPATMTFNLCGATPRQIGPIDVTFRLKGHGSFRSLAYKAAIKIKVPSSGRAVLGGLKSLTLNNQVQDPSAIHETLAYSAFRSIGIPAIRAGYANLTINNANYGLHANVESTDDRYLNAAFPGWSHLYEPQDWSESPTPDDFGSRDIIPDSVANFQIEEGSKTDVSDLTTAAAIMDLTDDADWWAAFQQRFDVDEALKFWALEYYLGDSDNYVTFTNNYFLVSSNSGVFSYLPWGTDKTFTVPSTDPAAIDPTWSHSPVVDRCFNYAPCKVEYRAALTEVAETILSPDLVSAVNQLYRVTAAHVKADPRKETTTLYSCQAVNATISFLVGRATLWENAFGAPGSAAATVEAATPVDCTAPSRDTEPPVVTVSTPLNDSIVDTANVTLLYDATDDSGVAPACTRDSGSVVALEPGENQITFGCSDVAKNTEVVSLNVTRDIAPPEVEITEPSAGDTTDASATLHFTATDDSGAEPTCDPLDGDTVPLSIGSNTITVTCTDAVGRQGSGSVTVTRLDIDPPVISDVSPATGLTTTDATLPLTYSATDNSGAAPSCTPASGTHVELALGLNNFSIECTDAAGNTGSSSVTVTRLDIDPPVISDVSPATGLTTTDATVPLTYSATDNSDAAPSCTPASGTHVELALGLNNFSIECKDAAGNTGLAAVVYTRVDNSPKSAPTALATPAAVTIDKGKRFAHRFRVRLNLSWPQGATRAKISNSKTFRHSRTVKAPKHRLFWRLPRRGGLRGKRTVYVKFFARDGSVVAHESDSIRLSRRASRN